jgi:hypothetical protein
MNQNQIGMLLELASFFLVAPALIPNVILEPLLRVVEKLITTIPKLLMASFMAIPLIVGTTVFLGIVRRYLFPQIEISLAVWYTAGVLSIIFWPLSFLMLKDKWIKSGIQKLLGVERQKRLLVIGAVCYLIGWFIQFLAS